MTIDVINGLGGHQTLEVPNANGRAAAASSRPVALSTEDLAALSQPSIRDSTTGAVQRMFVDPAGEAIQEVTTLRSYFSDDFGGVALDTTNRWDVYDGGLGALNGTAGNTVFGSAQAAIGTGITGITHAVGSSALTITMGTTTNAEKWFVSKQMFCCTEDVLVVLSRTQGLVANSLQIGLIEVDPTTGWPALNPNIAGDFTNRVTVDFAQAVSTTALMLKTVSESSPAELSIPGASPSSMTGAFESTLMIRAEDVHLLTGVVDSSAVKTNSYRVSSQVPNDTKVYKLIIRARNIGTPATTTNFVISRIMVQNHQALNVAVTEASGSPAGSQGLPVTPTQPWPGQTNPSLSGPSLLGKLANVFGYTDTATPLAGAATFPGTTRSLSSADHMTKFNAVAYADVAGTLYIFHSTDSGANFFEIASVALTAGTTGFRGALSVSVTGVVSSATMYQVKFVNGAGAQGTFRLSSSFSAA